jgi:hypothetical protein
MQHSADPPTREAAWELLRVLAKERSGDPALAEALVQHLVSTDPHRRVGSLRGLAVLEPISAHPDIAKLALNAASDRGSAHIRVAAAEGLATLSRSPSASEAFEALRRLTAAEIEPDPTVRFAAVEALDRWQGPSGEDVAAVLAEAFRTERDPRVRNAAVLALVRRGRDAALPSLVDDLLAIVTRGARLRRGQPDTDTDADGQAWPGDLERVRLAPEDVAAQALAKIADGPARDRVLRGLWKWIDRPRAAPWYALRAIAQLTRPEDALPTYDRLLGYFEREPSLLVPWLPDIDPDLGKPSPPEGFGQWSSLYVLRQAPNPLAIVAGQLPADVLNDRIGRALKSPRPLIRVAALRAAAALIEKLTPDAVLRWFAEAAADTAAPMVRLEVVRQAKALLRPPSQEAAWTLLIGRLADPDPDVREAAWKASEPWLFD